VKKWIVPGAVVIAVAAISVLGASPSYLTFDSAPYMVAISQTDLNGQPQISAEAWWGPDIAGLAMGTPPSTSEVLAVALSCDGTAAILAVYDASNASVTTIAQTTSFDRVVQADPLTGITNQERYVAMFNILPMGNIAGGYLTMAGRAYLDTNGCVTTVLASKDRNSLDKATGDMDIAKFASTDGKPSLYRSGQAHFIGLLDVISNGQTNTVLIPSGHLTSCQQLN
jgi:hypothetical protein